MPARAHLISHGMDRRLGKASRGYVLRVHFDNARYGTVPVSDPTPAA